jgi:hypothetical protein
MKSRFKWVYLATHEKWTICEIHRPLWYIVPGNDKEFRMGYIRKDWGEKSKWGKAVCQS